ncbi:peroxide stress protein YaaA [Arthrobacter sp. Br18]|uniref:YaaA family protein n=1 Tax=Arthrobacter sp. Br18 TaxID=1312954 RepID=UPI000479F7A9|nr:peroxide stress protein YaaA [Arthrobacter sp. Br18]
MLILLPPSEGKTAVSEGLPISLSNLHFPALNDARTEVLAALRHTSGHPDAHRILGVGSSLAEDVKRNRRLDVEPSGPAHDVYSGVLYDALDYPHLTPRQKEKAREHIVIVSALWGALRFGDPIPAYRLSMSVDLPGTGRLASFWKRVLDEPLRAHAGPSLVIDCRSSTYAAAWSPPPGNTVAVNVYQERNGERTVVSHFAKHTRGELVRHLITRRGRAPESPAQLLRAAQERWTAELEAARNGRGFQLNVLLAPPAG